MKYTINDLIKRLGIFVVIFISLVVLVDFINFDKLYHKSFINLSKTVFSNFGNGGIVDFKDGFEVDSKKYNPNDCMIIITSKQQKKKALEKARKRGESKMTYNPVRFSLNSWNNFGYLLLFFLALTLILPIKIIYKLFTFIFGSLLIHLFFYIKIWVSINLNFSRLYGELEVGWTNDFSINLLNYFRIIIMHPFFGMVLITLITLFLSFRYWNLNKVNQK